MVTPDLAEACKNNPEQLPALLRDPYACRLPPGACRLHKKTGPTVPQPLYCLEKPSSATYPGEAPREGDGIPPQDQECGHTWKPEMPSSSSQSLTRGLVVG